MSSSKPIGQVANYKPISKCGMEELAVRQRTILPSGGVSFARNPDGVNKIEARQKVLDLFSPSNWSQHLNMLTMPGLHWRFERQLLGLREPGWMRKVRPDNTHFTGIENDRALYFAAVTQMPGVETPKKLIKPVKRDRFPFAELAIKSRYASFFFADVDDVLCHEWQPAAYREPARTGWDAAWLDYTGPLSVTRLAAIAAFYKTYVRGILIITALNARWDKHTNAAIKLAGSHSNWLAQYLPGEVLHDFEYYDTSPMVQYAVRKP